MSVLGLHHITIVTRDAQRNLNFYAGTLGLRLVKRTVNFDDPGAYHLYYGDETGSPGTAVTFFEWPGVVRGHPGIGGTHHMALSVDDEPALLKWKRYLTDRGITVRGPYDRTYFRSIYFDDPDGTHLEIATRGPGWTVDEPADALGQAHITPPPAATLAGRDEDRIAHATWPEPVPDILPEMALRQGMHHITAIAASIARTHSFYGGLLGLRLVKQTENYDDPTSRHWYWAVGDGQPGTIFTAFERDPKQTRRVTMGAGQTHHFALAVKDEQTQLDWRERLMAAGLSVSPVLDRVYFKSIYTRDPDGHIVELATLGPGFAVDEPAEALGSQLMLPSWLEPNRSIIAANLRPLSVPAWKKVTA